MALDKNTIDNAIDENTQAKSEHNYTFEVNKLNRPKEVNINVDDIRGFNKDSVFSSLNEAKSKQGKDVGKLKKRTINDTEYISRLEQKRELENSIEEYKYELDNSELDDEKKNDLLDKIAAAEQASKKIKFDEYEDYAKDESSEIQDLINDPEKIIDEVVDQNDDVELKYQKNKESKQEIYDYGSKAGERLKHTTNNIVSYKKPDNESKTFQKEVKYKNDSDKSIIVNREKTNESLSEKYRNETWEKFKKTDISRQNPFKDKSPIDNQSNEKSKANQKKKNYENSRKKVTGKSQATLSYFKTQVLNNLFGEDTALGQLARTYRMVSLIVSLLSTLISAMITLVNYALIAISMFISALISIITIIGPMLIPTLLIMIIVLTMMSPFFKGDNAYVDITAATNTFYEKYSALYEEFINAPETKRFKEYGDGNNATFELVNNPDIEHSQLSDPYKIRSLMVAHLGDKYTEEAAVALLEKWFEELVSVDVRIENDLENYDGSNESINKKYYLTWIEKDFNSFAEGILAQGREDLDPAAVKALYENYLAYSGGQQLMANPLGASKTTPISSHSGWRLDPIREVMVYHYGDDLNIASGTPLYGMYDGGEVVEISYEEGFGGNILGIKYEIDGKEYLVRYAHLASINVAVGQTVDMNTNVGFSGATGGVTGPHLHLETYRWDNSLYNWSGNFAYGNPQATNWIDPCLLVQGIVH